MMDSLSKPLLGAVVVLGIAALSYQYISSSPSGMSEFIIYAGTEDCIADGTDERLCAAMQEQARYLAENTEWGFADKEECFDLYGVGQCEVGADDNWRLALNGFTQFGNPNSGLHNVLPIFRSDIHRSHYLPNGYPVVMGSNTILLQVLELGTFGAGHARNLGEQVCYGDDDELQCAPLYQHLQTIRFDPSLISALFNK